MSKGKYGDLIKQARKPENQVTSSEPPQDTSHQLEVNLCVKVPVGLRRHWAAEAKRQGTTMTAVIIEALTSKFGEPS